MKIKVFAVILLALAVPLFVVAATVSAQTFRSDQSVTISSDETVDGSAFVAGSSIDVSGKVDGDLYCAGQNITISGEVAGDVLCVGQTLTISGNVTGNVRLAGQTVALSGNTGKGASIVGQSITLQKDGFIGQDATIVGQNVNIDGPIGRDLVLSSLAASINSSIGRNVTATIEALHLTKGAVVGGTLNYTSPQMLTSAEGAVVSGKITYTEMKENEKSEVPTYNPFTAVMWSLMLLVSAIIFALLFPRLLHSTTQASVDSIPRALIAIVVGFVAGVILPIAFILLMITVLGIPFAFVVLLAWFLILALSGVFASYFTGRIIWRKQTNPILIMLVGASIIALLLIIPVINVLVALLCIWYGSGAILLHLRKFTPVPSYNMSELSAQAKK